MEYEGDGIGPAYTRFADGTPFEKEFLRSSFIFLNVIFYYTILNKTDFLYYIVKP